ncbi:ribosome biogenesis GTPase YlqF [Atopobacter phocae]|uniref:ribosome biogenesis GTPase YlqF n=1 Tax=Atopobacter phocae TaxID=136492 RepID=UPI00046F6F08|nr:ribosome biogenesis GTPase YlqF [Atopobacter phocae]
MATIQWFPGHMAKTIRQVREQLKHVDVVVECLDARVPLSSRNPVIDEIRQGKKHIILLNKVDLADPKRTDQWTSYYQNQGAQVVQMNAKEGQGIDTFKRVVRELMAQKKQELEAKGVNAPAIRLLILGIPNAGKSTLINRLVGKNQAQTANRPGVTQSLRWMKVGTDFELLDTPGILWPKFQDPRLAERLAITGSIKDQLLYLDDIALSAMRQLNDTLKPTFESLYKVSWPADEEEYPELLIHLAKRLGFRDDYEKASIRFLKDLRAGRLGRFTYDHLDEVDTWKNQQDGSHDE